MTCFPSYRHHVDQQAVSRELPSSLQGAICLQSGKTAVSGSIHLSLLFTDRLCQLSILSFQCAGNNRKINIAPGGQLPYYINKSSSNYHSCRPGGSDRCIYLEPLLLTSPSPPSSPPRPLTRTLTSRVTVTVDPSTSPTFSQPELQHSAPRHIQFHISSPHSDTNTRASGTLTYPESPW